MPSPAAAPLPPTVKELKSHSATLTRLLKSRLAPSREETLVSVAVSEEKPLKPPAGDCCGSSCDPCVMDLYAEELKVWKECVGLRDIRKRGNGQGDEDCAEAEDRNSEAEVGGVRRKVPGAFEW